MNAASEDSGAPQILSSYVAVWIGAWRYSLFFWSMYGVRSYSHFCDANSAVQITSDEKTSHSPDFASWRWTNCWRCSSAEVENSRSFALTPLFCLLNALIPAVTSPPVSLPMQTVTLPFAV